MLNASLLRSFAARRAFQFSFPLERWCSATSLVAKVDENLASDVYLSAPTDSNTVASPTSTKHNITEENVKGTVKWFSPRKSIGFIALKDREEEVFVHASDIAKKNPRFADASLMPGEEVEFCLEDVPNSNRKAVKVTGPGGAPVRGIFAPWTPEGLREPRRSRQIPDGKIIARDVKGTVKSFHLTNGWGFVTRADTGEDIFVGVRGIMNKNPLHPVKSLREGEPVQFHVLRSDNTGKEQAVGVTGPDKQPVQGNPDADGPLALRILNGEFRRGSRTNFN